MEYVIAAGVAVVIVLAVLLLAAVKKAQPQQDTRSNEEMVRLRQEIERIAPAIAEEFARSRRDEQNRDASLRAEMSADREKITARLDKSEKAGLERELQLNRLLSNSLTQLRDRNEQHAEKQTRVLEESLEKLREGNEKKLEQMRATVSEKLDETLGKRLDSSFETVSKQLENVYRSLGEMKELSAGVTDNVSALNRVLTNVKARGTWAEVQLKGILDQIIPGQYVENYSPKGTGSVEFAVIIPSADGKKTYLPLDSKFPMEDYIRVTEAAEKADAAMLKEARKALQNRVTEEAKDISSKYISVPDTTPFAILYLATEGLYAEVMASGSGLAEKLHTSYRVLVAGPTTITALLNSLAIGFRSVAINEKAEQVRVMLTAVKAQYDKFGDLLAKAQKKVDEAGKVLEDAQKRNVLIHKKLREVQTMEADKADALLLDEETHAAFPEE